MTVNRKSERAVSLSIRGHPRQAQADFDEFVHVNVDATSGITRDASIEANSFYCFTSTVSQMNETAHHKMVMNYKQDSTPPLQ